MSRLLPDLIVLVSLADIFILSEACFGGKKGGGGIDEFYENGEPATRYVRSCESPTSCEESCSSMEEMALKVSNLRNATIAAELQAKVNMSICEETFYPARNRYEHKYCCDPYEDEEEDGFDGRRTEQLVYASADGDIENVTQLLRMDKGADVNGRLNDGSTPLQYASRDGQLEIAELLIDRGAEIDAVNARGRSALFFAADSGHLEIVKLLVRHGAKHYDVDIHGESPLHRAAKYDHLETVQYLLAQGANVDEVDANGQTALHKAADYGHLHVVKYLARRGSRPDKRDEYGYSPMATAAQMGRIDIVRYLISTGNVNIENVDIGGETPLFKAADFGQTEVIAYLVAKGANINVRNRDGVTPLIAVSGTSRLDTVSFLVDNGAEINAYDNFGRTPIYMAAFWGHLGTVKYLHGKGATADVAAYNGWTPLFSAAAMLSDSIEIVKYLHLSGARVGGANTTNGETPIFAAARKASLETVSYLAQNGGEVDAKDIYDRTPLYMAAFKGDISIVKYLRIAGAAVDPQSRLRWTPLLGAVFSGDIYLLRYLVENGADVNVRSVQGITPLWAAAFKGFEDKLKYLVEKGARISGLQDISQVDLAADRKTWENLTDVRLDDLEFATAWNEKSPMHVAIEKKHVECAEYILSKGKGRIIEVVDELGQTPLHYAAQYGPPKLVRALMQAGANREMMDKNGMTPVDLAKGKEMESLLYR